MDKLEALIPRIYDIEYVKEAPEEFAYYLSEIEQIINTEHFIRSNHYRESINNIYAHMNNLSTWKSDEDRLLHTRIKKGIANLVRQILDENKKIFIVHGRNIAMRDKVTSLLGRLKLDYSVLEAESNKGETVIEKFMRNAESCRYAVVLFSADDIGGLNREDSQMRPRVRQNVILELGYFLGKVGRHSLMVLHEAGKDIEKPSDFNGIVYEPFDEYGAWKQKLIREMRLAKIYIEPSLAERV